MLHPLGWISIDSVSDKTWAFERESVKLSSTGMRELLSGEAVRRLGARRVRTMLRPPPASCGDLGRVKTVLLDPEGVCV